MVLSAGERARLPALRPPPPPVPSGFAPGSSAIPRSRRSCLPVPIRCGLAAREAAICPRGIPPRIRLCRLLRRGEVRSSQPGVCAVAYKRPRLKLCPSSAPDLRSNQRQLPPRDRRGQIEMAPATSLIQSGSRGSGTSVTSPTLDPEREDFHQLMTLVEEAGAHEGSDEHYYASQLFMNPQCRHSFSFMCTNEGRLSWIRRTWERLREKM